MNLIKGIDLDFGIDFDFRGGWVLWVRFGWDFGLPLKYGIIHSTCNSNHFFVHTIMIQFPCTFLHSRSHSFIFFLLIENKAWL